MRQIKIINSFTNRNEESLDKYLEISPCASLSRNDSKVRSK